MIKNTIKVLGLGTLTALFFLSSCKKTEDTSMPFPELETAVINDFVDVVANPLYAKFESLSADLKLKVEVLAANPTEENLANAKDAWKAVRVIWEQSEGFLIGPVNYLNYDPFMDTWPTDHNAMNNLLASSTPISVSFLAGLDNPEDASELTLRGFHPLEFLMWGLGSNRAANTFTTREKEYMVALASDIHNNVSELKSSWLPGLIYYSKTFQTPGADNSVYTSKKEALETIANSLIDIVGEVAEGKMLEPYDPQPDSTITESPYSHNSLVDFKNNIIGARNVYLCSFDGKTGKSLSDLVKANNSALDLEIKAKFDAAINTFGGFTTTFEDAVYNQRTQVQVTLSALGNLQTTIGGKLIPYIQQYVKD